MRSANATYQSLISLFINTFVFRMLFHLPQRDMLDENEWVVTHYVRHEGNEVRVTCRRWIGRRQRRMRDDYNRHDFGTVAGKSRIKTTKNPCESLRYFEGILNTVPSSTGIPLTFHNFPCKRVKGKVWK